MGRTRSTAATGRTRRSSTRTTTSTTTARTSRRSDLARGDLSRRDFVEFAAGGRIERLTTATTSEASRGGDERSLPPAEPWRRAPAHALRDRRCGQI